MAQKDTIWGGIRGSNEPIRYSDPLWKDIFVYLLICITGALVAYLLGGR